MEIYRFRTKEIFGKWNGIAFYSSLDCHYAMLDGKMNEFGIAVQPMRLHDLVFVELDGTWRYIENRRNLLGRASCRQ